MAALKSTKRSLVVNIKPYALSCSGNLITYILEAEGFNASVFKPNLILINEMINNRPGHRLCRKIKQNELKNTPVIVLSAANDIELIATECLGNEASLMMPIRMK